MVKIPKELREYIDFLDGKVIVVKELPDNLKRVFKDFMEDFENTLDPGDLSE